MSLFCSPVFVGRVKSGNGCSVVFVVGRGDRGDSGGRRRDAGPGNRDNHKMVPFLLLVLG